MSALALQYPMLSLKARATRVVEQASKTARLVDASRGRVMAIALLPTAPALFMIGRRLDAVIDTLNSPALDRIENSEVKPLAHELSQLSGKLRKMVSQYDQAGVREYGLYRSLLERIESGNSHLLSIVEGLYLSMTEGFGEMMTEAANELRAIRDGSERSVLVGQV